MAKPSTTLATVAPTADARRRRRVAEKLLDHLIEHAKVFAKAEALKDLLRGLSIEAGEGFTEKVDGKGKVRVSKESVARLKGIMPTLNAEAFLALDEGHQAKLKEQGLVAMLEQWTENRKPSVSVDLE